MRSAIRTIFRRGAILLTGSETIPAIDSRIVLNITDRPANAGDRGLKYGKRDVRFRDAMQCKAAGI